MPRIKHTPRKVESAVGEGGYAPAPPALFSTVAATAVGPRIARVARQSPALGSSEGLDESGAAARGELVPPQQHVLSTPSCRAIIQPNRIPCVDPRCGLTFTRFRNMKRHAAQFHKLRADGSPATEVEHETAVLAAAERTSWARVGHAERQDRPQISVETGMARIKQQQQFGERPAFNDSPDLPDKLPRSAWVAALHRAFGCRKPAGSTDTRQWMTDRRPEDQAPREYLHVLLCDRPAQSIQEDVEGAVRRHGWAGGVARHAQMTMESLEMGRQRVLSDLRSLVPDR